MKNVLLVAKSTAILLLACSKIAVAQPTTPNLVTNGDLETRNHAPHGPGPTGGQSNIGPIALPSVPYADLRNWHYPPSPNSTSQVPVYRAADGDLGVGTTTYGQEFGSFNYGFTAHGGISCATILRHDAPGDKTHDDFITQQLAQPLLPGHLYHAEFWALRLPGGPWHTALALSVTSGDPTYDAAQNSLLPSPGNKVIVSADIQQRYVWTLVAGDIYIPAGQTTNQWVSVGYDRADQVYDPAAISDPIGGIVFAIDDISLVDMGCAPAPEPDVAEVSVDACNRIGFFQINNFNPAYTYTVQRVGAITAIPLHPTSPSFRLKGGAGSTGGSFTVTAYDPVCGTSTTTTDLLGVSFDGCTGPTPIYRTAATEAYPNPATESITVPEGTQSATLLDKQGNVVQKADEQGKLDVRRLPEGLYNLQLWQDGKLVNQHMQIQH